MFNLLYQIYLYTELQYIFSPLDHDGLKMLKVPNLKLIPNLQSDISLVCFNKPPLFPNIVCMYVYLNLVYSY